ncbi:pectate lyase family protein [Mucilaginibacter xinganensis]|uniref:Pectate lyase n=1 Tax=Mucilaginibacter xinganensis TaxID=1234841 RepID=A0A223NYI0_9SPHI|nr:hypothetical protein [Mucilaginibacter xinganensis]ASU34754.1 Pectate lyase [Mucilaginibacter xinganensis]
MKRNKKTIKNVAFASLALGAILLFGSCKKGTEGTSPTTDSTALSASIAGAGITNAAAAATVYNVDVTGLRSDGGYAYKIAYPLTQTGDSNTAPTASSLALFENGVKLGPAHSVHQDIRDLGKGRYSHWGTSLIFSASDNTNPATNGRKYTFSFGGSDTTASTGGSGSGTGTGSGTTNSTGVDAGLVGYALVNGTTTGGKGGNSVTVTSISQLKSAVAGSSPKIIYVSGTITGAGDDLVYVGSNTSIIGKPGATLVGLSLFMETVNNIIVQDIRFKNYVYDAAVMVKYESTHIWVDHCEFSTDRTHGWDYWGKDISITRASDFCTISWCKFHDTNLSVLISGGIIGHEADKGKLHITLHHNYWYNVSEREPDMNYGSVHLFNNYHLDNNDYSIGARAGGNVRTDNEYFQNCAKPLSTNLAGDPPGYFSGVTTNVYANCGKNDITTPISTWVPAYSYKAALDVAANVPSIVTKGTGPRAIH